MNKEYMDSMFENKQVRKVDIFTKSSPQSEKLRSLLNSWAREKSKENRKAVLDELMQNNPSLLLLTLAGNDNEWRFQGLFLKDGIRSLRSFSDEEALFAWIRKSSECMPLSFRDLIRICKSNGIERIEINSGQPNMFVVEKGDIG